MLTLPRTTRRSFLGVSAKAASFLAFSRFAPSFLVSSAEAGAPGPEADRSILVLVQLAGGNDGLNTVVPFADDRYHKLRPTIGFTQKQVLPIDDLNGLHPALKDLHQLYGSGDLAILQGVGYPNPNRSHFRSTEIWETAADSGDNGLYSGWIGRYLDNECSGVPQGEAEAIFFSRSTPQTFESEQRHTILGISGASGRSPADQELLERLVGTSGANENASFLKHTLMDALVGEQKVIDIVRTYRTEANYGGGAFGRSMRSIAAMIASGSPTRVYFASLGGFDTHVGQLDRHQRLMMELSRVLHAFQSDLRSKGLDQQVLTLTFSEFGRRPRENDGKGTDHGTAAPLFVMGGPVQGGILGAQPDLDVAPNGDLTYTTDFRRIYATVLDKWLGCPSDKVLGESFEHLPLFRSRV